MKETLHGDGFQIPTLSVIKGQSGKKELVSWSKSFKMTHVEKSGCERQLQIQQCKVQEIQSSVTGSGDETSSGIVSDEEIDKQELEAHYGFMAKIQEVLPAESSSTDTPLEQDFAPIEETVTLETEKAKKSAQLQKDKDVNGKPSMIDPARLPNTANGCKPKPRNWQASMSVGFKQDVHLCQNGFTKDELHQMASAENNTSGPVPQCLVLHQMTSDHNRSELGIHDHSNEPSSSKLVPKVVPLAVKTATSRQELELLFHLHIAMLRTTEHPSDTNVFTMKMEILLEPASNKLLVGDLRDSI
ncbi:hypothetical protein Tco_0273483 [Tanacetum coccineum]